MKVCFLGLGSMGSGVCRNLLNKGYAQQVWNRSPEKAAKVAGWGAEAFATPQEAARGAGVVLSCLSSVAALKAVAGGEDGVFSCMGEGMAFYDMGLVKDEEPFRNLLTQGMVNKDGKKMSKSIGNVVSPEEIIAKYGADTARLFILFAAPPDRELDWSDAGVEGSYRFLNRVYRLIYEIKAKYPDMPQAFEVKTEADKNLNYVLNYTIKKVSEDAGGRFNFNTAISSIMELVNEMYKYKEQEQVNPGLLGKAAKNLILILSPFVPHICEEMWEHMGETKSVTAMRWPEYDESALVKDTVEVVVQINGKVKDKVVVSADADKGQLEKIALENDKIKRLLEGRSVVKVVAVPGRLINIVVK